MSDKSHKIWNLCWCLFCISCRSYFSCSSFRNMYWLHSSFISFPLYPHIYILYVFNVKEYDMKLSKFVEIVWSLCRFICMKLVHWSELHPYINTFWNINKTFCNVLMIIKTNIIGSMCKYTEFSNALRRCEWFIHFANENFHNFQWSINWQTF